LATSNSLNKIICLVFPAAGRLTQFLTSNIIALTLRYLFMGKKAFIDNLHQIRSDYRHPSQAYTTAKLLNTVSADIYSESQRFLFELIQNADDAAFGPGNEVHFEFLAGCLIACHKGKPFTESDLEAITDAGASTKTADATKTGYKGIGFKSVFGKSKKVTISSDGYLFKFDRVACTPGYPWQVIPIWVEPTQLEAEAARFIARNEYSVYTCLDLADTAELLQEMGELLKSPQLLLFLRNITKISVSSAASVVYSISKQTVHDSVTYRQVHLFSHGELISAWLLKTFESIELPVEVRAQLEDDEKTPEKLKHATVTEVAFAAKIVNGSLLPLKKEERLLFTYLPTKVSGFEFPFLVNGTFMTNASREALHEDAIWNRWHFELLAVKLLDWLELLATSEYRLQLLSLLPARVTNSANVLKQRFDKGLMDTIAQKAFVLTKNLIPKRLGEVILDKTGLSNQDFIEPAALLAFVKEATHKQFGEESFVHPDFKHAAELVAYGMEVFERENVELFFKSAAFRSRHAIADNVKLIAYLKQLSDGDSQGIWFETLKELPFIYDTVGTLRNPETGICFPTEVAEAASTELGDIPVIHPEVYEYIVPDSPLYKWLEKLGVKRPSEVAYVTNVLIPGIKDKGREFITKANYLPVTHYLFRLNKEDEFSDELFESLRELKVKTTLDDESFREAQFCYLASAYRPVLPLESVIEELPFVSDEYLSNGASGAEWYLFFKKLKVKDRIELEAITANNSLTALRYLTNPTWVATAREQAIRDSRGFGFEDYNIINGILLPSFINLTTNNIKYSRLFWSTLLKQELDPRGLIAKVQFKYGWGYGKNGYSVLVNGYFEWFIQEQSCIPTTTGELLKASDVLLNTKLIKETAGRYLPVFDSTADPNQSWRNILHFRNRLHTEDHLLILSKIAAEGERAKPGKSVLKNIGLVYQALSETAADSTPEDRQLIQEWAKTNSLLTSTLTFELPSSLLWIKVEGFADMAGKVKSIYFPENAERNSAGFAALLELLGIRIVDSYTPNVSGVQDEVSLKEKLLGILPYLAALNEKKRYVDLETVYPQLKQRLLQTAFYNATAINLLFTHLGEEFHGSPLKVLREKNDFYFTGNWRSALNMYLLVPTLSALLDFSGFDHELRLLLELGESDTHEWLDSEGLDKEVLWARCRAVDAHTIYEEPTPTVPREYTSPAVATPTLAESPPYAGEMPAPAAQTFRATIAAEDIDLSTIAISTATYSGTWSPSPAGAAAPTPLETDRNYSLIESDEDRTAIGRWCEVYVNRLLTNEPSRFTQVEWANAAGESGKPYDFKVLEHGIETYIEVKGTPSVDKAEFYFSTSEWRVLFEQQERYNIYRVFEAGEPTARLAIIEYPSAQLIKGELLPARITLKL
jgi:hypothetical protein